MRVFAQLQPQPQPLLLLSQPQPQPQPKPFPPQPKSRMMRMMIQIPLLLQELQNMSSPFLRFDYSSPLSRGSDGGFFPRFGTGVSTPFMP